MSVMWGLFFGRCSAPIQLRLGFILALLQQRDLLAQQQDFPLLCDHRIIERRDRVLMKCQLALHFHQLLDHVFQFHRSFPPPMSSPNILPTSTEEHDRPMNRKKKSGSRLVYSTDGGRLCPQCHRAVAECVCGKDRPAPAGDGVVRLHRETKGRGGKAVTVVTGVPLAASELKALAKTLKQKCGVGGALKGDTIEIQGDQRDTIKVELEKRGYIVKIAGG